MRPGIGIALLGLLAFGCVSPTPYQPATDSYGYGDQRIENNRFRITFSGNSQTERQTVENYLLYRAAEVTLAQGGDYFRVADRDVEVKTQYHTTTFPTTHFLYGNRFWYQQGGFGAFAASSDTHAVNRYTAVADILVMTGTKPEDDTQAYDANQIVEHLGPTVKRKAPAKGA